MSASSSSLNGFVGGAGGIAKDSNVPIGHLDYAYISKCDNAKELEEIIKVLRLGSEGYYPDLLEYTETRLKNIDPKSSALRIDTPAQRYGDLDKESKKAVVDDLQDWMNKMNSVDSKLKDTNEMVNGDSLPPVRSKVKGTTIKADKVTEADSSKNKKSVKPREFREWEKFDIDKELAEIDKNETSSQVEIPKAKKTFNAKLGTMNQSPDLKPEESLLRAVREKEKGNEAFKAMDYEEAMVYYTRSLIYEPTAASYNNRAAAELKVEKYAEAIEDCKEVLQLEPNNIKAFLRRGMAYKALKHYKEATKDFQTMLSLDANNKRAKELLAEIEEINRPPIEIDESETRTPLDKSKGSGKEPSQKKDELKIDEDPSTEDSPSEVSPPTEKGTEDQMPGNIKKKGQRLKIIEVDGAEVPEREPLQPAAQETGNETLGNTKSKKKGQRLKIEEVYSVVDSGNDVVYPTHEGTGEDSKGNTGSDLEGKVVENPVKPGASNDPGGAPAKDAGTTMTNTAEGLEAGPSTDVVKEIYPVVTPTTTHGTSAKLVEAPDKEEAKIVLEIPDNVKSLMEQGNRLYKTGHYAESLEKFSKCVDSLWKDREAYGSAVSSLLNNKAACYLKMGDCKQCVNECDKSLRLISDNIKVLIRRGIAYETMEKYAEAFRDFNRVRLLDGSNKLAQEHCSRVIKNLEMLHGKSWRKEIFEMNNSDEGKTQAFPNMDKNKIPLDGIHISGSKKSEKTLSSSPPQVDLQPEVCPKTAPTKPAPDDEVKVNHKDAFEKKKQEQYLKRKDNGNVLVKQGKHEEAIKHYTDCIKLCPQEVVGYTNRALCFIQLKKHELAEADCDAALDIQADNIKALFRRAKARMGMKRYRECSQDLVAVLKLDAKNSHAKTELQQVVRLLKKEKEDTEKSTGSKRKRIVIKDIEGDEDKASSATVTGENVSESEGNEQSSVVKDKTVQQSSSEKLTNGKNSVPVKEESPPLTKDTKSSLSERNKDSKDVKKESIQGSSDENNGVTDTGKVSATVAKDTTVLESVINDEAKVVKKECLQPSCSADVEKEQKAVLIKHNVKTAFQFLQTWKEVKNGDSLGFLSILKQVNLADLRKVISNRLDADMIKTIFQALELELKSGGDVKFTYDFLQRLHCVERFEMTLMFQSKEEKRALANLFDKLIEPSKQQTQINCEDLAKLRKIYCV